MTYFLTMFIKYFKMGLVRLSGEFSDDFQVVIPEQQNQLNYLVQFCFHLLLFSLDSSELSAGLFHPVNLEFFYFVIFF